MKSFNIISVFAIFALLTMLFIKTEIPIKIETHQSHLENILITAYPMSVYEAKYYSQIIYDLSGQYMDTNYILMTSIAFIESGGWNAIAKNPSGAEGIMQTMPSTSRAMCDSLGIQYKPHQTECNVILSLVMGAKYISYGYKKGIQHAIKYYVGGPNYHLSKNQEYITHYSILINSEHNRLSNISKSLKLLGR